MSAIAPIALLDGQSTPVSKTFDVQTGQQGTDVPARWLEKTAGSFSGFKQLSLLTRRSESGKSTKVMLKVVDPTLAVTAPASGSGVQPLPTAAYQVLATVEFVLPDACSVQNRMDIIAYVKSALADTIINDAVVNLSPAY